jgi:RNA polymerase sigma-70 factor (ECF subfamily)
MYNNKEKSTKLSQQSYKNFRDEELIFKIVEENQLAFKELFVRYALKVKFLMLKMGTKELDAEEITQEVMLSLWRKANTYDTEKASAATWVFTIARNHRIDLFRKSSRLKIDPLDPTFVP